MRTPHLFCFQLFWIAAIDLAGLIAPAADWPAALRYSPAGI
jgi:hypothetical protein